LRALPTLRDGVRLVWFLLKRWERNKEAKE
jgi:hypothetical protein